VINVLSAKAMNKIIISLTSIASRRGALHWTLDSLHAQTLAPTEIRLYVHRVHERNGWVGYRAGVIAVELPRLP
jgi:hypothetical protein